MWRQFPFLRIAAWIRRVQLLWTGRRCRRTWLLLFVNARQTLILSEATQQVENQNAPAMGRPACAIVPQVMNTGRAALSLGCCGARAYLDVLTDDVAVFAIPGAKLEAYTRRIEALAKANACPFKIPQHPAPRGCGRGDAHDQGFPGCLGALRPGVCVPAKSIS